MRRPTMVVLIFGWSLACSGVGERVDTAKIIPVDDINARDTTTPPAPPQVSRLSLMDSLPGGGLCTVRRYRANADQAREVTYETTTPPRTYVVEVGKPPRQFPPVSMDMRGSQRHGDLTETENVFVGFSASGSVSVGTRRYTSTGNVAVNDREPLRMADSATAIAFARRILDLCDR